MKSKPVAVVLLAVVACAAVGIRLNVASSGAEMTAAGKKFVDSLSEEQRGQAVMDYEAPERTDWHYIPKPTRKGLIVKDMNDAQRKAAFELLRSALSAVGYDKARQIMQLEALLDQLEEGRAQRLVRDPEKYYFTLFGTPGNDGRWGLSVEGHHLSLNFVVDADRVVSSTPTFYGANPATLMADYGGDFKKGLRVLAQEEQLAFDLLSALSDEQRQKAVVADKAPNDVRDAGKAAPPLSEAAGLAARDMTPKQVKLLEALIDAYAHNLPADVAQARLSKIAKEGIEGVTFAWAGGQEPGTGHDYRVQGESFLIEFNNTQPDSAGNPANHIHCVWHDRAGNFAIPVEE